VSHIASVGIIRLLCELYNYCRSYITTALAIQLLCELYNYSVVAHYSVLIAIKFLTAVNTDVMVCCDVTSCEMVQMQCILSWEGHSASIFDVKVIRKNFIVPALGIVALGQCLLRLILSVLQVDIAGCSETLASFLQIA
jgi:hypothetical protein